MILSFYHNILWLIYFSHIYPIHQYSVHLEMHFFLQFSNNLSLISIEMGSYLQYNEILRIKTILVITNDFIS